MTDHVRDLTVEQFQEVLKEFWAQATERRDDYNALLLAERSRTLMELRPAMQCLPAREGFRYVSEDVADLVKHISDQEERLAMLEARERAVESA